MRNIDCQDKISNIDCQDKISISCDIFSQVVIVYFQIERYEFKYLFKYYFY